MELWQSIVLGIVQGITEFLPISSSGHLVLVREFIDVQLKSGLAFDALVHLATTAAVVLYFWKDILGLLQTLFRKLGRLPVNEKDFILLKSLLVGTIPAVIGGVLIESYIQDNLQTPITIATGLLVGALFFMYAEWRYFKQSKNTSLTVRSGFLIGLFQMLALVPGLSRSGTTLSGGMVLGLSRYEASRFSFLLAIPITAGVGIKKSLELITTAGDVSWGVLLAGAVTAFLLALLVIHFFLVFIRRYTLWPFIWYSFVLSGLIFYGEFFVFT